jgi:hypothetical protein
MFMVKEPPQAFLTQGNASGWVAPVDSSQVGSPPRLGASPAFPATAGLPQHDASDSLGGPGPLQSALAGLTVQQLLDLDVEAFAVTIDRQQQRAKKAILVIRLTQGLVLCIHVRTPPIPVMAQN